MAKKDEQRTEIIVAVLTVIVIFSFAGILSWGGAVKEISKRAAPNIVESQVVGGSEGAMKDLPEESISVVETASAEVTSPSGSATVFGTPLSPAISQFSVEEGTELSPGTAILVVGSK